MAKSKVISAQGKVQVTEAQKSRVRAFLDTVDVKKKPDTVVIVPEDRFKQVTKSNNFDTNWAYSLPSASRVYINAAAFNQKHPNEHYSGPDFVEFVLGHELAHLNDSLSPQSQKQEEHADTLNGRANPYDLKSQDLLTQWQQQGGPAYSILKQQAPANAGVIQPTPMPVGMILSNK